MLTTGGNITKRSQEPVPSIGQLPTTAKQTPAYVLEKIRYSVKMVSVLLKSWFLTHRAPQEHAVTENRKPC